MIQPCFFSKKHGFFPFTMSQDDLLQQALEGDIHAFQALFVQFQDQLKSYLFRMLASRATAEDIAHDTFIRAYDKLATFQQHSSLKTWVFRIATNLAYTELTKQQRWVEDVSEKAKALVQTHSSLAQSIEHVHHHSMSGSYDIKEHISTCFTCIAKNLAIENQIALLLKDVYDFTIQEIMQILQKSKGQVKYLLQSARTSMTAIFDRRCALVNKQGICHQCSELNGWFNPKQQQQEALLQLKMVREADKKDQQTLFQLRTDLVKAIDPLRSSGNELQEVLLNCNRMAMGELPTT